MSRCLFIGAPSLSGGFLRTLQNLAPDTPHREVLWLVYTQMILARTLPCFEMVEKNSVGSDDIIYRSVAYMAAHFREDFSLTQMAEDLGYSPYALSRVFSSTFHCNFNTYLNNIRLDYSCNLLQHSDRSITDICHSAGFGSLRTFNRTFLNTYKMSPRDYRKMICEV